MITLAKDRTEAVLALHGWSAVFLGLLLFWVILTGSIAVFSTEIDAWANPRSQATPGALPNNMQSLVSPHISKLPPEHRNLIIAFPAAGGLLGLFIEGHNTNAGPENPDEPEHLYERILYLDPSSGDLIREDDRLAMEENPETAPRADPEVEALGELANFFVRWHVNMHIPNPWGLLLTGILGLSMMVAAITGFLMHKHLFKELFTLRRFKGGLIRERDAHVIAGTWSLPFAFLLAFTGSFFSLATSFAVPAVAMVSFGGDQERLIEELLDRPEPGITWNGDTVTLDTIIDDAGSRYGEKVSVITILNSGRDNATVVLDTFASGKRLVGRNLLYDGITGEYRGEDPLLGDKPSAGNTGLMLMSPLHFGNFAGVASKLVWLSLGLAAAYVTFTGLTLFTRRREEQRLWRALGKANIALGYGLPLAMTICAHTYFITWAAGMRVEPMMMGALAATLGLSLGLAGCLSVTKTSLVLSRAMGISLILLPITRLACGGVGWHVAFQEGFRWVLTLDIIFPVTGIIFLFPALFKLRQRKKQQTYVQAADPS